MRMSCDLSIWLVITKRIPLHDKEVVSNFVDSTNQKSSYSEVKRFIYKILVDVAILILILVGVLENLVVDGLCSFKV